MSNITITTTAKLVYRKAKQVSSVTYNLFTIAKKFDSEIQVAGMSAPVAVRDEVRNELIKHFPTMESLFGPMDFCECEHCRSVLSPAAYLVDLLQFIDAEPQVWANFLTQWKATHNQQDYPHKDNNGNAMKPYDVLIERRPDIPYIALTCENTHTALPYIDIVNEILEYYVANDKLTKDAAHDTGDATTAELLAEPQNVISAAYDKVREARYPLNLPFDLWIETVRQFCNYLETPLARVLEVFRPSDDLFAPLQDFERSSIFFESLGLSTAELEIFTDADPLAKWYELYGFKTAAEAMTVATDATTGQRIDLNSAKALSRRLDVTYKEIAEIVQAGFVNPKLAKLGLLCKLGVSIHDVSFYFDHKNDPAPVTDEERKQQLEVQAFAQELKKFADTYPATSIYPLTTVQLENELGAIPFNDILVLADPDAGCNFDLTTLQYADGKLVGPIALLRINLFVRLWRKLGWSIEETDRALTTFIPGSAPFDGTAANLAKQPLKTALIYLAHLKALDEKVKVGKQSRIKLLTMWSGIATTGKKPLYGQLFLSRSVLKNDAVFDHPLGLYVSDMTIKIKDHVLALQGALGITSDDIGRILMDDGKNIDTAELSLPNVSLLYRYNLLAKALKFSVRELISLKQLSGLNPFTLLHSDPLADTPAGVVPPKKAIEFDYPFSQTLRFVEVAEEVKDSGLKVEDLEYLLRHHFDETGKYRPHREGMLALMKTLAEGVRAIRIEHAVPDDPGAMSEEVLRQKLGLALTADVVERFLAMMNGMAEFTATKAGVTPTKQLLPEAYSGEPSIRELPYNITRQEQKLTFKGVLFDAEKAALKARLPKPVPPNPHTPSQEFSDLLDDVQQQAHSFFEKHLQKQAANVTPASGFLDAADFELLFDRNLPLAAGETEQDRFRNQRIKLANAFLPFLQQRLIRQFIVQTMAAHTGADPVLVESLTTDDRLLKTVNSTPLLNAFSGTGERGVTATFYASATGTGASLTTVTISDADTGMKDKDNNPVRPSGAKSARIEGYLEVSTPGAYRFYVVLDKQNAEAELSFSEISKPMPMRVATRDGDELGGGVDDFVELKPGIPYRYTLNLRKLNAGEARLLVQGETLPKAPVSQLTLYPLSTMAGAELAVTLLTKALQLVQILGLSEREIRYLLTHAADFAGVSLSEIPTEAAGDTPAENAATQQRFGRFLRLAAYARLKRDLAACTDDLVSIFEANASTAADKLDKKVYPLIAKLTRRDEATVKATAESLSAAPAFASEEPLKRLWEALQVVECFGVPVASLLEWSQIVTPGATPQQRFEIARDLKESIKARFEPGTWQHVAQPIFDTLRQRQRDALVSHIMHQHGFDRMEQLYEYFLIDPGMEPVVQTSRIRLAISSVQLFIQRCLLNLEPKVPPHPDLIKSKQWEWMKRYRVWEANRKIFLFPENWLEPEFRDDKTHLFAELEGALLQGDVSSDLVEDAFLNYLKKLDELARLDIVAMHIEDNPDPVRRILHVIGRTYSQPHKYFYRRYAHQMWTNWEPVTAEIEGDHLVPVIWRDRLYLFWVTFMEKADPSPTATGTTKLIDATTSVLMTGLNSVLARKQVDVQLHWSEYLQGVWTTRESGGFSTISKTVNNPFNPIIDVFVHVSKYYEAGEERGVYIHLGGAITQAFYLAGRNSTPEERSYSENSPFGTKPANPYSASTIQANRYLGNGALKVTFAQRIQNRHGAVPFYHLFNEESGGHFYTIDDKDRDKKISSGDYVYKGVACYVLPIKDKAGIPLYRCYNAKSDDHFYTTAKDDNFILKYDYKNVGVACHVLPIGDADGVPLYCWRKKLKNETYHHVLTTSDEINIDFGNESFGKVHFEKVEMNCLVVSHEEHQETIDILQRTTAYTLLPCDNNLTALGVSEDAYQNATYQAEVHAALELGIGEIGSLMKPVFYQDNTHTLFIEPDVTERTIEERQSWVTITTTDTGLNDLEWLKEISVSSMIPRKTLIPDPAGPIVDISPEATINPVLDDWLVNTGTVLELDGVLIGPAGHSGLGIVKTDASRGMTIDRTSVNVSAGSVLAAGSTVVVGGRTISQAGLTQGGIGLNIVGRGGLNSSLAQNLSAINRSGFGAGGVGR